MADEQLLNFLTHFGLGRYFENGMDCPGLKVLKCMDEDESERMATHDLGIENKSHVVKFVKACAALKNGEYIPRPVREDSELVAVSDESGEKDRIFFQKKLYSYGVNVHETMKKLATDGALLQDAARDGNYNAHVVALLDKHAKIVKDSPIASSSFVRSSLTVLQYHKLAIVLAEENKEGEVDDAFILLAKCGEIGKEMSKEAEGLAIRSRELNDQARTAMSLILEEKIVLKDKIKQMKADIATGKDEMKEPAEEARYGKLCASEDALDKVIKTLEIVIRHCGQIEVAFNTSNIVGGIVGKASSDIMDIVNALVKNGPERRMSK